MLQFTLKVNIVLVHDCVLINIFFFRLLAVQDLLKCPDLERNARNTFGETSVLLCLKENVAENIINILLDYDCDCTTACFKGITPVHIAALNNRENLLIKFLERGADVNATSDIGVTPLHLAILASNYEIVRRLLEYNANPNLATSLKFTPLMFALSFQDIDIRICDLLCSLDIHAGTTLANPLYCAIKSQHPFVERLILNDADVNFIGKAMNEKVSCLILAISQTNKRMFDLIWPRFDQQLFSKKLNKFLIYFIESCSLKGTDLVDCLKLVLGSEHASELMKMYFYDRKQSFLESIFENAKDYQLTTDNCREILRSLPIVYYHDISYIYKKFNFNIELTDLLTLYELNHNHEVESISTNIYLDFLNYNNPQTTSYNLREILHIMKFYTPDVIFRTHFYNTFSGIAVSTDVKLAKLQTFYNLCEEIFTNRSMASLQELSRDKIRHILFQYNKKPYKAIHSLPIPEMFKDILFFKLPIYC